MAVATALLLAGVAGSLVFCLLVAAAARSYLKAVPPPLRECVPISILKPLHGLDDGLEENLRSYFRQDYPTFEVLCAVRDRDDPAVAVFEKVRREFPGVPARMLVVGEPPYPNPKVFSLDRMLAEARYGLLAMSDSDTRTDPNLLRILAAEFQDSQLGVASCPYRAVAGRSFWSTLEAVEMNTEFLAGVLTARLVEGVRFGVGPCCAARRQALDKIGGFDRLREYLAEDFVMGAFAAEAGFRVVLSSHQVEHRIGSQRFISNFRHRLRWARSTRRSRPWGYVGQLFTYPVPLALALVGLRPEWWPVAAATVAARALAAWATASWVLHDPLTRRRWWLVPVQDLVSFLIWIAGFFGGSIVWRGRRYELLKDGRFRPVPHS